MNKNIVLCGFMGSGKSVTGKALANCLNAEFIDMDAYIEKTENMSVSEIFEKFGENHFRNLEAKASATLGTFENKVIACGGGTVVNPENTMALKQNGELFYLSVAPETVINRLKTDNTRPLLAKNKENAVNSLLNSRAPIYEAAADHIIDANKSVTEVVEQILKIVREA